MGELALDGTIRPIHGALPIAVCALDKAVPGVILPLENDKEASIVDDVKVASAETFSEMVEILNGTLDKGSIKTDLKTHFKQQNQYALDFAEVKGQDQVKRALEAVSYTHLRAHET